MDNASIFQAEVEAVRQASIFFNIDKARYLDKFIKILVDSGNAKSTMCQGHKKLSKLDFEIP